MLFFLIAALEAGCDSADPIFRDPDFAVLAQSTEGYAQARPDHALKFPRDHGPHPGFRIEWWYLTANLQDASGKPFGAQWTLFRLAVRPPGLQEAQNAWQSKQVYMAHFAITTPGGHSAFQRYSRGGEHGDTARAGVNAMPFAAWLDDWSLQSTGNEWLPMEVRARQDNHAIRFDLEGTGPLVLQGEGGFSQKHPNGGGSFYYSQPFLRASGEVVVDGMAIPVNGQAWLDREWSSQLLQDDQAGWDWFSLHLETGEKLMLFQLRQQAGEISTEDYRHAVLIASDGGTVPMTPDQIRLEVLEETAVAGRLLPLRWRIELPQIGRDLEIEALHPDQWMEVDFPYWEGAVTVSGNGPGNRGRGYLELTGYRAE